MNFNDCRIAAGWFRSLSIGAALRRSRKRRTARNPRKFGLSCGSSHFVLESRDVPAIVSWTGAAANGLWSDARNWSGGTLPGFSDEVTIALASTGESGASGTKPVTIDLPVVISRIESALPVRFVGLDASLRLTGGESKLMAGLDLQNAGLAVQGGSTRLFVSGGDSKAVGGVVVAVEGGGLTWSGLTALDRMVVFVNAGSSVSIPQATLATNVTELTVLAGSLNLPGLVSHVGGLVSVLDGGVLSMPNLANASGTFIEANGAGTKLELPALNQFDRGRFRADAGSEITAGALQRVTIGPATAWSFSWFVGPGSRLVLPALTAIDVAPPVSSTEAPDARILLRGDGRLTLNATVPTKVEGQFGLAMSGNSRVDGSLILGPKSVLSGSGTIAGSLDNAGTIMPSGDVSPYGTITVTGNMTNRPGATIELQMGGPAKLDRIFVQGQASILGGTLNIRLSDEFAAADSPTPVGQFTLMTWSSWAGQFTSTPDILNRSDGSGITSQSLYLPNRLEQSLGRHRTDSDVISVSDMTFVEGNAATSYGYFVVSRSGPMTVPITVQYEVIGGSAVAGRHFTFPNGPITFAPGETERRIRFVIRGNKVHQGNVTFQVRLKSVSARGVIGQSLATVTIREDDPAPRPIPRPIPKPVPKPAPKPVGRPPAKPKPLPQPAVRAPKPAIRPTASRVVAGKR